MSTNEIPTNASEPQPGDIVATDYNTLAAFFGTGRKGMRQNRPTKFTHKRSDRDFRIVTNEGPVYVRCVERGTGRDLPFIWAADYDTTDSVDEQIRQAREAITPEFDESTDVITLVD